MTFPRDVPWQPLEHPCGLLDAARLVREYHSRNIRCPGGRGDNGPAQSGAIVTNVDQQLANWREQKKQRERIGDSLDQPRDLDHVMVFRRRGSADAAAQTLRDAGFHVVVMPGLLRTTVQATRANALGDDEVARVLHEVVAIAEAHGGQYDGFGGEVVPNELDAR